MSDASDGPIATWNPYYEAYASSHGRSPSAQQAAVPLFEFVLWMSQAWQQWRALRWLARGRYERAEDFAHWVAGPVAACEVVSDDLADPNLPF